MLDEASYDIKCVVWEIGISTLKFSFVLAKGNGVALVAEPNFLTQVNIPNMALDQFALDPRRKFIGIFNGSGKRNELPNRLLAQERTKDLDVWTTRWVSNNLKFIGDDYTISGINLPCKN